jgi:hypothetical protein
MNVPPAWPPERPVPPAPDNRRPKPTGPDVAAELARLRRDHRSWGFIFNPFTGCFLAIRGREPGPLMAFTSGELDQQIAWRSQRRPPSRPGAAA